MMRRLAHLADMAHLRGVSRVIVAHNPVGREDDPSTSDVLAQADLVAGALGELGIEVTRLAVSDWRIWEDLAALGSAEGAGSSRRSGSPGRPDSPARSSSGTSGSLGISGTHPLDLGTVVFNLVEAPPGVPGVHPATAAALELMGVPFSGSGAASLWLSTDKLATRAVLAAAGLPVPAGGRLDRLDCNDQYGAQLFERVPPPWILKPACEDASLGLDGEAVCATREAALARAAELLRRFPGQPLVVERYLPGRELNVSLLAAPADRLGAPGEPAADLAEPIALPVAEIEFVDFPESMPRIVGYEAKWQPESFAYTHTVRRFPQDAASAPLLAEVRRLAVAAWRACGLGGYGRVDLRLDEHGAPYVLEVNANPCLAADAGFMAAAEQAGLTAAEVIARIVSAAVARHHRWLPAGGPARRPALAQLAEAAGLPANRTRRASSRRLRAVS